MKKKLIDFLPNSSKLPKSIYTMVKFNNRKDLLIFMVKRVNELRTSKNAYILALIEQDLENGKEK